MAENWEQYKVKKSEWDQYKVQRQPSLLQSIGQGAEQFARGTVKQLPLIGMLGGGAVGTALGPWGTVGGAAAGGGVGAGLKNIIEQGMGWEEPKPILENYYDIAKGTLEGATAEAGGAIVGKGLGLAFEGASKLPQAAREMVKKGMPITRGTLLERIGEKIPPGSWWFKKYGRKLNEMAKESSEQFTKDLKLVQPSQKAGFQEASQKLFEDMTILIGGPKAQVKAPELYDLADSLRDILPAVSSTENKLLRKLVKQIETKGTVDFDLVSTIRMNLKEVWDSGNKKLWHQMNDAIMKDIETIANETTPQMSNLILNSYEMAMGASRNVAEAENVRFLRGLFRKATPFSKERGEKVFNPESFRKAVNENMGELKSRFSNKPEVVQATDAFADFWLSASHDLSNYAKTKPWTPSNLLTPGATAGAISKYVSPVMVVPWGFETIMAHSLASPKGLLKKFLFREGAGIVPQLGALGTKETLMNLPITEGLEGSMP